MAISRVTKEHNSRIHELFQKPTDSIKIVSPFITKYMGDILADCMEKATDLRAYIITRFYREDFIQGVSDIKTLKKLNECGVQIYALQDLHAKLYLFDDDHALIGSANFTSGGFKSNHELSLYIADEPDVNDSLVDYFEELLEAILAQSPEYLLTSEKIKIEQETVERIVKERRSSKGITHINGNKFGAKLPTLNKAANADLDLGEKDSIQTILSAETSEKKIKAGKSEYGQAQAEDQWASKLRNICARNGIKIRDRKDFNYANRAENRDTFDVDPRTERFSKDWWLLLNEPLSNKLHVFYIPANELPLEGVKYKQTKPEVRFWIKCDDDLFEERHSGIKFKQWLVETIDY